MKIPTLATMEPDDDVLVQIRDDEHRHEPYRRMTMIARAVPIGDKLGLPLMKLIDGPHAGVAFILWTGYAVPEEPTLVEYEPQDQFCYVADSEELAAKNEHQRRLTANANAFRRGEPIPF